MELEGLTLAEPLVDQRPGPTGGFFLSLSEEVIAQVDRN